MNAARPKRARLLYVDDFEASTGYTLFARVSFVTLSVHIFSATKAEKIGASIKFALAPRPNFVATAVLGSTKVGPQVGGAWHFGEIVRQLLGGKPTPLEAEQFIAQWLQHWQREVALSNGDRAMARPALVGILSAWKQASQRRGINGIDLSLAPFRLLGIANRLDLRDPFQQWHQLGALPCSSSQDCSGYIALRLMRPPVPSAAPR